MMYKSFKYTTLKCHILNDSPSSYILTWTSHTNQKSKHIFHLGRYNWMLDGHDNLCNPGVICIRSFPPKNACQLQPLPRWINRIDRGFQRSGVLGQMLETCQLLLKGLRWALRWAGWRRICTLWGGCPHLNLTYLLKICEDVVFVNIVFFSPDSDSYRGSYFQ